MAKTPSKPTSTSKRKSAAVKTAAPKSAARAPKAPATKPRGKKPIAAKAASKSTLKTAQRETPAAAKASQSSLQSQLDAVTKRLIAANKKTQKNVKALEADFSALAEQMGRTKAGQTKLTSRVTKLSNTLRRDLEDLQSGVKQDLTQALHNPTSASLQAALTHAENRLSASETAQNTAIERINRHIADIATIVDTRLSDEAKTREAAMAEMKRVMEANHAQILTARSENEKVSAQQAQAMKLRFSNLQSESAVAVRSIGNKVVEVAEEMGRRRDVIASQIRQELNEATLSSSAEFEQFRRVVERRLEALETDLRDVEGYIDRSVAPLSSRIEGLEYGLSRTPAPKQDYAPSLQAAPPMMSVSPRPAEVNQEETAPQYIPVEDAFSPVDAPSPYQASPAIEQVQNAPLELETLAAPQAVPYDPSAYPSPATYAPPSQPAPMQNAYEPAYNAPEPVPAPMPAQTPYETPAAYAAPQNHIDPQGYDGQQPQGYTSVQPPFPNVEDLAIVDGDLPYADPAYAETQASAPDYSDDSMSAARPGGLKSLKSKSSKTPNKANNENKASGHRAFMTPRNLRLGGLVAALGLVGFIGAQSLAGKNPPSQNTEFSVASNAALDESRPSPTTIGDGAAVPAGSVARSDAISMAPTVDQSTIGQYADNRKMALTVGGESLLSAAAKAGNPAAQLQLGLDTIETGDLESGVALIRAAANQEQPAALYRLAKLYETGQGVGQDSKTARQLTERAARGGNRIAMHDLALYYAEEGGRGGVKMDMPTAAGWFEKAAERGVVDSQYNLGILFESGQGLPQDLESALVWYSIAGAQGDQMAAGRVNVLRQTLNEDQISRADTRIAAFTPTRIDEEANGIFSNVPWAKPAKVVNSSAAKTSIVQTQTLLNTLGYAVGTVDGAIGPKTKNAILNFQRNNGLSETGVVNAELIERLELAAGA